VVRGRGLLLALPRSACRALVALVLLLGAGQRAEAQFCPCYALGAVPNTRNCGVAAANGTNPTVAEWQPIFDLVGGGPTRWGTKGPPAADITSGCSRPMPPTMVSPTYPCELLRAIAMQETGWRQFCTPTEPANMKGPPSRTIVSFDCGYGIGQVTSGMRAGEMPAYDRARVASDPTYNLATGAQILSGKWRAVKCVGDRNPNLVEDWYLATWGYNGFASINDPNNASYDAMRPVCNPNVGCPMRPYQERVWGWMEHPRSAQHWTSLQVAYPDRTKIVYTSGRPTDVPEPSCAGPTDCARSRPVHLSACLGSPPVDGGLAPPDGGAQGAADGGALPDSGEPVVDGGDADAGASSSASGCGCTVGDGRREGPGAMGAFGLAAGCVALFLARDRSQRRRGQRTWS
jgi:hypothetical protein